MTSFELPLDDARERVIVTGSPVDHERALQRVEHVRTHGIIQAVGILASTLDGSLPPRAIGKRDHPWSRDRVIAKGWPLYEHMAVDEGKPRYAIGGILLGQEAGVYTYNGVVTSNVEKDTVIDARGHKALTVVHANAIHRGYLICRDITQLDLTAPDLDQAIGAISGRLTLPDLLAGLAVTKGIEMPLIEVLPRLADPKSP